MFLMEALHACDDSPGSNHLAGDQSANPRLHVSMHQVVARQLLDDEPPETWQTVQRLADAGYDWHTIMHMIAELVTHDVWGALAEDRKYDPADYARRLSQLPPSDWPAPGVGPA